LILITQDHPLGARETPRAKISGRVFSEDGQPIPQARVDISTAAPKSGPAVYCPSCYLDCRKFAITNQNGEFQIADVDPNLKFRLVLSSPAYQTIQTELLEPSAGLLELRLSAKPVDIDPGRVVSGEVRNEHGAAIAGALIVPCGATSQGRFRHGKVANTAPAVTDARGHFSIVVPDSVEALDVEIEAEGTCGAKVSAIFPGAQQTSVELPTGASIVGTLTRDGTPVAGMSIAVAQTDRRTTRENAFVQAIHAITDADGRFQFDYLPPNQQYCIYSVVGEANRSLSQFVLPTKVLQAPSSEKVLELGSLEVTNPVTIQGKVKITTGEQLRRATQLVVNRKPAWDLISISIQADGTFSLSGLPPETYELELPRGYELDPDHISGLLNSERSLRVPAKVSVNKLVLPIKPKGPLPKGDFKLDQDLSGVVVAPDGSPLANIHVSATDFVDSLGVRLGSGPVPWTNTDEKGRFVLTELPDVRAWLVLRRPLPDGRRFNHIGMLQPQLNATDLRIVLNPSEWAAPEEISGTVK